MITSSIIRPTKRVAGSFLFLVCLIVLTFEQDAVAQTPDEAAVRLIYEQISAKRAEIAAAEQDIVAREQALDAAEGRVSEARLGLSSAETDRRIAQNRSLSSASASNYLSGTQQAISELRSRRASAISASERDVLDRQIRALTQQLSEEATTYARASNGRLAAMDSAIAAVERAEAAIRRAEQGVNAANAALDAARERKSSLEAQLNALLTQAAEASDQVAPGYVQSVRVVQDGNEIYRASWADNTEEYDLLVKAIADLEKQLPELDRIKGLLDAERRKYQNEVNVAVAELPGLREELEWNEGVILWSDRLYNFGQLLLLVATPAAVVEGVYLETTAMLANAARSGTAVTRTALTQFIAREVPRQTALQAGLQLGPASLPNFLAWPEYARRAGAYFGAVSRVNTARQMLMAANAWAEPAAVTVTLYQFYSGVSGAASGSMWADTRAKRYNDADQRRFDERMRRGIGRIEAFSTERLDFIGAINARKQYEMQSALMASWALEDVNKAIRDRENSWARTLLVGHIWDTNADIAMAYDLAQIRYWEAARDGYRRYVAMVDKDIDRLAESREETEDRLRELREELPGAAVRKLTVHTQERLRVQSSGNAQIEIVFTQPLSNAPTVQIGPGAPVAYSEEPAGNGLPLPDLDGAVLATLSGSGKTWSGTFPLRPLRGFIDRDEPLPISITAPDAAGRNLDADPRTSARTNANGGWTYVEETRSGGPSGRGGPDRWHEINIIQTGGTSYVIVVDASGSMLPENNPANRDRMVDVRRSARSFMATMTDRDEVAVYAFYDCNGGIVREQDFTRDKAAALSVIDGIEASSGTPLAEAIRIGGQFLLNSGHFERKSLIVLTDGEESCSGDPQAAAAEFRDQANILGDIANSEADLPDATETPSTEATPDEEEPEAEAVVAAQPDDRTAWRVEQTGSQSLPTFVLVETRFREWGEDGECAAQVTERKFYSYYAQSERPDGEVVRRFGVNERAFSSDTLDFAMCLRGRAGMDQIRSRWANLNGTDFEAARSDAQARAYQAME